MKGVERVDNFDLFGSALLAALVLVSLWNLYQNSRKFRHLSQELERQEGRVQYLWDALLYRDYDTFTGKTTFRSKIESRDEDNENKHQGIRKDIRLLREGLTSAEMGLTRLKVHTGYQPTLQEFTEDQEEALAEDARFHFWG